MPEFLAWLSRILDSWKFWIVIPPWEVGVRVRLGKNAVSLAPGLHFRIPMIDTITQVNTRLRVDGAPPVTIKRSSPHCTRYISATFGYRITDPLKAMMLYGMPQSVIASKVQAAIAEKINESEVADAIKKEFPAENGVVVDFVKFIENVEVKTYRVVNGMAWMASGHEQLGMNGGVSNRY